MNIPAKLLLIYSTLFIIFLIASPLLLNPDEKTLITQAFLAPVALYFIFTLVSLVRKKNDNVIHFDIKGSKILIFFIILIIFSGIAFSTIYRESSKIEVNPGEEENPQIEIQIKTNSTPTPSAVTVKIESRGNPFVNLRESASLEAKIIARLKDGDQFVLISNDSQWYKITDNQSLPGYIYKDYVEESNPATGSALPE